MSEDNGDYKVGYGKPPLRTRFRPGKSGNPEGRRKKIPDLSELIGEELDSMRLVEIDNKRVRLPVKKLLIKQFFRLALKGDPKTLHSALGHAAKHQEAAAKRASQNARRYPSKEELDKMTDDERTDLYMKTVREMNGK